MSAIALTLNVLASTLLAGPLPAQDRAEGPTYAQWLASCRRLPTYIQLGNRPVPRNLLPLPDYAAFAAALDPFLEKCRAAEGELAGRNAWLGARPEDAQFFNLDRAYFLGGSTPFQPFAERRRVLPGTRLFLHGDLHGDLHSLLAYLESLNRDGVLEGFRVVSPEVRLVFLGDYTDRGRYGVEVLYTLLRLKLASPDRVWLVRGNHEDVSLTARYGFFAEVAAKYGRTFDLQRVSRLYDFLPAVLYVACGTNAVQCNHGGLEPGFNPGGLLSAPDQVRYQLLGRIAPSGFFKSEQAWITGLPTATRRELQERLPDFMPTSPTAPSVLGFLWNDFTVVRGEPQFRYDPDRAFVCGDEMTRRVLQYSGTAEARLRAIFRAHQHSSALNPLMRRLVASRGVFRHWQERDGAVLDDATPDQLARILESRPERGIPEGSVWTFNVSPDSAYGVGCGYTFDAAGEVTTAERWEDWRLRVLNTAVSGGP